MNPVYADLAVAEAWVTVCDELVAVVREGDMLDAAINFMKSGEE